MISVMHTKFANDAAGWMLNFFTFESMTTDPEATTAPEITAVAAQPPTPTTNTESLKS